MYKLINVTVFRPFTAPAAEKQLDDFQDYLEAETHGIENGNCDQLYPCEISFANILSEVTNYNQYLQNFQANFTIDNKSLTTTPDGPSASLSMRLLMQGKVGP